MIGARIKIKAAKYIINNLISPPNEIKTVVSNKIGANTKNNKESKDKVI